MCDNKISDDSKIFDDEGKIKTLARNSRKEGIIKMAPEFKVNGDLLKKTIKAAARAGQLNTFKLSKYFLRNLDFLEEFLIESCVEGDLEVVQWLIECTAVDINEQKESQYFTWNVLQMEVYSSEFDLTLLKAACQNEHLHVVKYLANALANVNRVDRYGLTLLLFACIYAPTSVASYLLGEINDLDVNYVAESYFKYTALHAAIWNNKDLGITKLHRACAENGIDEMTVIAEIMSLVSLSDHMINAQDNAGNTPLHYACYYKRSEIVKILMLAGADETITNIEHQTPALKSVRYSQEKTDSSKLLVRENLREMKQARKLINLSTGFLVLLTLQQIGQRIMKFTNAAISDIVSVIQLSNKSYEETELLSDILITSCYWDSLDVMKRLVDYSAVDVNCSGKHGTDKGNNFTPLTIACYYRHLNAVKFLVEMTCADVNLPDEDGYTPLITACISGDMSITLYLLREVNDLDVNIANTNGDTALHCVVSCSKEFGRMQLHWACIRGDVTAVMRLVYRTDQAINAQSNAGYTPLHFACHYGHKDTVKILLFAGADKNMTDMNRRTPAQVAESQGHIQLLSLFDDV